MMDGLLQIGDVHFQLGIGSFEAPEQTQLFND
jgi:hypothetical protein